MDEEYVYDSNPDDDRLLLALCDRCDPCVDDNGNHCFSTYEILSSVTVMIVTHLQPHTNPNTIMKSSLNPWHPPPPRQYQPTLQGH